MLRQPAARIGAPAKRSTAGAKRRGGWNDSGSAESLFLRNAMKQKPPVKQKDSKSYCLGMKYLAFLCILKTDFRDIAAGEAINTVKTFCSEGCVIFRMTAKPLGNKNFHKGNFFDYNLWEIR